MPSEEPKAPSLDKPIVPDAAAKATAKPARRRRRWRIVIGILVITLVLFLGVPRLIRAFNTVSTDDAYVNGYVTFVAPRVSGQVTRVLVDDDNRVKKGDVLVELDPKPHQVEVAIKPGQEPVLGRLLELMLLETLRMRPTTSSQRAGAFLPVWPI